MNAQHDAAVVFELHRDARLVGIFFSRAQRANVCDVRPPILPQASCGLLTSGRDVRARRSACADCPRLQSTLCSDRRVAGFTQLVGFQSDAPTMFGNITNTDCCDPDLGMSWPM